MNSIDLEEEKKKASRRRKYKFLVLYPLIFWAVYMLYCLITREIHYIGYIIISFICSITPTIYISNVLNASHRIGKAISILAVLAFIGFFELFTHSTLQPTILDGENRFFYQNDELVCRKKDKSNPQIWWEYVGEYSGVKHFNGKGTLYLCTPEKKYPFYTGNWKKNIRMGKGSLTEYKTFTMKDGSISSIPTYIFEGFYKNNFLNGKGKHLRYINENLQLLVYEGDWLNGRPHGYGKKYDNGRLIYEGEWQNDQRHGHGKEYVNGQLQYEGDFQEDKRHGHGKLFQPDGTISYEGRFRNNNPIPATSN